MPKYNIGIECNGIYWHSGINGKKRTLTKYNLAEKNNIKLLTFWEDDIRNNIETIESRAFGECTKLRSLALPDSVKTCYRFSFDGCTALTVTYKGKEYNHQSFDKLESAVKNNH